MEKQIEIRRAKEKDIKKVMDLLSQVLEIHRFDKEAPPL